MILFIDLGYQTGGETRKFAFWDTIDDVFIVTSIYAQAFESLQEFEESISGEDDDDIVARCRALIPKDWPDTNIEEV